MGWLIALAIIAGLAIVPLGISAKYNDGGAQLRIIAGPVRIKVFPGKKKESKKKPKRESTKETKTAAAATPKEKKGGSVTDFMPLVQIVFDFLKDFGRKLRVSVLELEIILAGGDPCDLAVNYGKACAALCALEPQLDRLFIIKKKNLQVMSDFTADKTLIWARIDLTVTLGRLISLLVRHGSRTVRELLKIMKLRKGGALQ